MSTSLSHLLLLLCAFGVSGIAAPSSQWMSSTRSTSSNRNLEDTNATIVDCASSVESVSFTTYLHFSGASLVQGEVNDNASTLDYDLLIPTLIDTYNEYRETECGEEKGGTTIGGARILRKEGGDLLLEVDATCVGCVVGSDLILFNPATKNNGDEMSSSNVGGAVRTRRLSSLQDSKMIIKNKRLLQENATTMDRLETNTNITMETTVETNNTMEPTVENNISTLESTMGSNDTLDSTLQSCYCEPQLQNTFADKLQEALVIQGTIIETPGIAFEVTEVSTPVSCDSVGDVVNLTEVVLVDFVVTCSLVDDDSAILANAFVNIYNTISQKDYCDPYFRQLTSARVIRRGDTRSEEGALTIELELMGTCRGCDPEVDGFYDPLVDVSMDETFININEAIDTEITSIDLINTDSNSTGLNTTNTNSTTLNSTDSAARRSLILKYENGPFRRRVKRQLSQQLGDDTCFCPLQRIASRAPSEAEVMDAFRAYIQTAEEGLLRCVTSIGQCQFGTTFESDFLVAFTNSNSTIDFASEIELSLQDTLNGLLAPRVGICRPEFRLVQSVSSTIGVTLAEEEALRRQLHVDDINGSHKRKLQDSTFVPAPAPTSIAPSGLVPHPTADFSSLPSSLAPSNRFDSIRVPTTSPTTGFEASNALFVLLHVTGVCNGCTSDFLLGNQVAAGTRNLAQRDPKKEPSIFDPRRFLQVDTEVPDSNCFCPIESVVQEGLNPSAEVVLDEYQDRLERSAVPGDVQSFIEVQVVNCEDEIEIFDTQVTLRFTLNQDVSDGELSKLAKLIEETYNDLTDEMYCDPLIRRVDNLDFISMTQIYSGQDGCDLFELTFEVRGACRGCEDNSFLFFQGDDDDSRRRLNIREWAVDRDTFYDHESSRGGRRQRQRRRLQGSELCLCEGFTIGNRAPSLAEFEEVLEGEIERERFDLICGLSSQFQEAPITDIPSTSPSSVPSESPTACTATLEDEFLTEIILFVERGNNVNADVRILLGEAVQSAYNELMQVQYGVCDPLYRDVKSISSIEEEADQGSRRNLLRVKEKTSYNHHSRSSSRNLQEIDSAGVPIGYIVSGKCESCSADSNIFDALTGGQVLSRVKTLSSEFIDAGILLEISEIESIDCSSAVVKFDEVVIVEMVATCPEDENFGFDDALIANIEQTFITTYNALAPLYCDQYFTVLADAKVENVGVITEDGNIPIEIRVFAECLGCDPQEVGIYGNPSAIQRMSDGSTNRKLQVGSPMLEGSISQVDNVGRFLQNNREACICSAQAVADRPPSESEFIEAFRQNVEALRLGCVSSVGECQFGSTFDTDIVLSFEGNQTSLTDEVRATIQENFLKLLNDLYEPNEDVCNPDFRVVIDVAVVFDFTLNGEFIESGVNGTSSDDDLVGGGRALVDDLPKKGSSWSRKNQETNDTVIPSSSPTTVLDVGSGDQNSPLYPTSAPTSGFVSNLIRTLLTVSGVCNGCVNELFLSNQILAGGRNLQEQHGSMHEFERWLQGDSVQANSNCFCPLTAIVNIVPPSPEEVQGALSRRLEEEEIELVVRNIDTVSAIACDDEQETTEFKSEFTISFSALATVPDAEIQTLGNTIAAVYNGLVEEYCDPLIRREVVLELKDRNRVIASGTGDKKRVRRDLQDEDGIDPNAAGQDPQAACVNFEATFEVRGLCRGCDDGTPLLDVSNGSRRSSEVHSRILSSGGRTTKTRRRHLMEVDEECFCDSNTIAPRAPTLEELWLRLELELGSFVGVCGRPVDCDPTVFVSKLSETTILALLLERGTVLTEEHLLDLELAYMSGYNAMQNNLRTDKCGGRFRQLSSLTADRSILGAGGGGIVGDGGSGLRNLEGEGEDWDDDSSERRRLSVQSIAMSGSWDCTRPCQADDDRDVIAGAVDSVRAMGVVTEVLSVNEYLTGAPSTSPSSQPSTQPSVSPSTSPSTSPSSTPSSSPSTSPSNSPSVAPSATPSVSPSTSPSMSPSSTPSTSPSTTPSIAPSTSPSTTPSTVPSTSPSTGPSMTPSTSPSTSPSMGPSLSVSPSSSPSQVPSASYVPSVTPSSHPSSSPSSVPSSIPSISAIPSGRPSDFPSGSIIPSSYPSQSPSLSIVPSITPSSAPSSKPSRQPSSLPSLMPSKVPSVSMNPSGSPSSSPSGSIVPSSRPSASPSFSAIPSGSPSDTPSGSINPSSHPSESPSLSSVPSIEPSAIPSLTPSGRPSLSVIPSGIPSDGPSSSMNPSNNPSESPSLSSVPSSRPSPLPSKSPSMIPSLVPSSSPSGSPSRFPSSEPSISGSPSSAPSSSSSICDASLCGSLNGALVGVTCSDDGGNCVCGDPKCPTCVGTNACFGSTATEAPNSCLGTGACGSARGTIGSGSCIGANSCEGLPKGGVGAGSCIGSQACLGFKGSSIGDNSCTLTSICAFCSATVGDNQCNGGTTQCPC